MRYEIRYQAIVLFWLTHDDIRVYYVDERRMLCMTSSRVSHTIYFV